MPTRSLRWGVISTANIGRAAVIPAIHAAHNGELLAVASRDMDRAADFASANGIPQAYASYEALLDADDIDAVYIPLPNALHHEWTIKAAEAGKHVLCEKPLALNAAQCSEMEAAAAEHGVLLMEAFMYRFHPRTQRVIELVQAGAIGEVRQINAAFTFRLLNRDNIRLNAELGGGSLMDVGCYCVNLIRTLANALGAGEPVQAQAFARWTHEHANGDKGGVDEQMTGTLCFASGLLASFDSALTLARREAYTIAGTDGYLYVPDAFLPGTADALIHEVRGGETKVHTIDGVDEYRLMVEHFAHCVLHGEPVRYAPSEAAANLRTIEALYRSARNAGRVEIEAR